MTGNRLPRRSDSPTVRYLTSEAELRRLESVDARVFSDPHNRLRTKDALAWVKVYSRSLIALLHEHDVLGYAKCLPLRPSAFDAATNGPGDLRDYLLPEHLLTDEQAIKRAKREGNLLAVGMVVYDPERKGEHYGLAAPLFRQLLVSFHALRLRGLLCQTETQAEVTQVAAAGCRKLRDVCVTADGTRSVWDFTLEYAADCPPSGLGQVVHQVWAMRPRERVYPLTLTQLRIIDLTAQGYQDKEIASFLESSPSTVTTHWTNILRRVREAEPHEVARVTRAFVVDRYRRPVVPP